MGYVPHRFPCSFPIEKRFFRSIQIYEKYFWQEAFFDQSQLKSVLGAWLPVSDQMSQETVDRMVKFIQMKYAGRDTARKQRSARKKDMVRKKLLNAESVMFLCWGEHPIESSPIPIHHESWET
jgi:hypothetical protein